ncbi:hypothetical protein XFF6166_520133 [Xanthomonas citri pv. fuscans]|nr:hypothetical protein XFF6166_520133 [Xanthomonas citri pv. fuscans]SOO01529.1 hypothetical protein XFF6960_480157 [Xanthomonas citri pv. fuscans]SOO03758.1 hypothetical protein XFF7767_180049 [Xanthomonas citri pv. fuscans]SOO10094.1 hypothetical protein XFF6970_490229 [Xanthomonas citri pv. fuscans]SOO45223.1 hypothetical protein XFF1815_700046 [Xanthomonas citri pv. fuscans]
MRGFARRHGDGRVACRPARVARALQGRRVRGAQTVFLCAWRRRRELGALAMVARLDECYFVLESAVLSEPEATFPGVQHVNVYATTDAP